LKGDEGTSVERSGAAQGLTEVICAGGARLVENVMTNDILPLIGHPAASYREGVLWVLTFLPSTLGQAFAPLIESAFPALISGLSDENEPVRDVAMRAGRVTIRSHGKAHVDKILPTLEEGLSDGDSRIRAASLNLLGDLLGCIGGSKISKNDGDTQDDIRQAERAQAQIALVLGPEIRKRVLSSLYLRRSDISAVVRQSAVQVWKSVVSVTPRTLKEILDNLVGQIVTALASGHPDHTQVAGRCLGDIVSKLGDTVFPKIIPVLRDALYRGDVHTRLGACVGLNEVIQCSSKEQIDKYLSIIVTAVQDALCDDLDNVREMAASCFQSLYSTVGNKAFDEVVPSLLVGMESNDEDDQIRTKSITGLTSILQIRSRELLPYLIPRLLKKPVTANQATALGSICKVTSNSINLFVPSIIPVYLSELVSIQDEESKVDDDKREESLRSCLSSLCSHIGGNGLNSLVSQIASKCGSDKEALRKESCWLLKEFIETRKSSMHFPDFIEWPQFMLSSWLLKLITTGKDKNDYFEEVPTILRELLYRLNDNCESVLQATNSALSSLSKNVPAEELVEHIEFIRNLLGSMVSESRRRKGGVGDGEFLLPGFNRPKGTNKKSLDTFDKYNLEMRTNIYILPTPSTRWYGGI
jgi:HEAT repeat protein